MQRETQLGTDTLAMSHSRFLSERKKERKEEILESNNKGEKKKGKKKKGEKKKKGSSRFYLQSHREFARIRHPPAAEPNLSEFVSF
jgi:hypothetical protein